MSLKEYQDLCKTTAKKFEVPEKEILTWGLGIAGEAGDVASCIKKTFAHDNDQRVGIRENIGETLWYTAMICNFFNWDLQEILEQNKTIIELSKNSCITNTNSHNKTFNLNMFLNETCKNAMNINEFVDSIKLQLSDLENVGEVGYIEGISSIIIKNLNALDVTQRPIHCTDKKRETMYIKDENKWEKDEDKSQMHKLIKRVVSKNMKMFEKYREVHPDCLKYHSNYSDQYNKIVYESMGGKGDDDYEKNEKIIKNVLKEVVVDKNL
jgi:NTP pyrophosphatase (non-canonical NTP hydrolase)